VTKLLSNLPCKDLTRSYNNYVDPRYGELLPRRNEQKSQWCNLYKHMLIILQKKNPIAALWQTEFLAAFSENSIASKV